MGLPDFVWDPNLGWSMGGWKEPVRSWEDNMAVLRKKNIGQPGYDAQGYRLPPSELYGGIPVKDGGYDFSTQTGPVSSNKYEATQQDERYQKARDAIFKETVSPIPFYNVDGSVNPASNRWYQDRKLPSPEDQTQFPGAPGIQMLDKEQPGSRDVGGGKWALPVSNFDPKTMQGPTYDQLYANQYKRRLMANGGNEWIGSDVPGHELKYDYANDNKGAFQNPDISPTTGNPWSESTLNPVVRPLVVKRQITPTPSWTRPKEALPKAEGRHPLEDIDLALRYLLGI